MEAAAAALEDTTRVAVQAVADAFGNQSLMLLQKARGVGASTSMQFLHKLVPSSRILAHNPELVSTLIFPAWYCKFSFTCGVM